MLDPAAIQGLREALREIIAEEVTREKVLPLVREEVRAAISAGCRTWREMVAPDRPPLRDDCAWGAEDAGFFLGVSVSEVRKLEREGKLPALPRYCNRLLFDPKIVRAFREGSLNVADLKRGRSSR